MPKTLGRAENRPTDFEAEHNWGIGISDCFESLDPETRRLCHRAIKEYGEGKATEDMQDINRALIENNIHPRGRAMDHTNWMIRKHLILSRRP